MTTCVVPGCNSNYHYQSNFTSNISFPTDTSLREKWFRAIPRQQEDYEMNKHDHFVLTQFELDIAFIHLYFKGLHTQFHEEDIEWMFLSHDGTKMVEMAKKITLKKSNLQKK